MTADRAAASAVERIFRDEYGRVLATLIRQSGDFELAEDALQDALASALVHWRSEGVPSNPGAWITTTARRKALDRLRREKAGADRVAALQFDVERDSRVASDPAEPEALGDDRLSLIFTCCHPALSLEARVALTLRTLGGLSTVEIARAFLLPEPTLAQRLARTKRKIRDAGIPYAVPSEAELPARLGSVLAVVYLIFNEGYLAAGPDAPTRAELAAEAIRLGRVLCELMPSEPEALGLTALMLLHESRRVARFTPAGDLVPLDDQDRAAWDRSMIVEGTTLLDRALGLERAGPYQVQAAIAALHAAARHPIDTDWPQIAALYGSLARMTRSPVVELNRAAAVAMADGPNAGLTLLDDLAASGVLDQYHLLHAARADLLRRSGRFEEAAPAYARALALTTNRAERALLERRLAEIGG